MSNRATKTLHIVAPDLARHRHILRGRSPSPGAEPEGGGAGLAGGGAGACAAAVLADAADARGRPGGAGGSPASLRAVC
jgi:hypothetical protein